MPLPLAALYKVPLIESNSLNVNGLFCVRLWPKDYAKKDHISQGEKILLRNAARNLKEGHFAVDIDPVRMSTSAVKMGLYLSPREGLVTFSIYTGEINPAMLDAYIMYVQMVEDKIYERLLDSKMLIVRTGEYKVLKFPYKHMILFPEVSVDRIQMQEEQKRCLTAYASYKFFHPIDSTGKEKYLKDLKIFDYVRKEYDPNFSGISELEQKAIFERLAPEYTVVMNEMEDVKVPVSNKICTEKEMRITGDELEYKTFFLDEYQVGQVNDKIVVLVDDVEAFSAEYPEGIAKWKFTKRDLSSASEIKMSSVEEFKGLESVMVIYIHSETVTPNMNYIAYTRAKYYLIELIRR